MRFGFIHRVMTDALAALGVLALVTSGELDRWTSGFVVVAMLVSLALPERFQNRTGLKRFATIGPLLLVTTQLTRLVMGAPVLELAVEFAAVLQIIRLATRRGAAHDQQVIVLALLHLIAGTVLGGGLGYGLCFLGFLIIAPAALVLSHLRREVEGNYRQGARDRTGLPVDVPRILRSRRVVDRAFLTATCMLSIPIFCFTALLFVLFPRVGLSFLLLNRPHGGRMIGFSDRVDLGQVGTLRSDPAIALRVEVNGLPDPPPQRLAMHLRGTAFDSYDGKSWSRSVSTRDTGRSSGVIWIRRVPNPSQDRTMRIELEPIDPPVLFMPAGAIALQVRDRTEAASTSHIEVTGGAEGEFRYSGADERSLRYDVFLGAEGESFHDVLSSADVARYTALPSGVSARVRALAHRLVPDATSTRQKANLVEQHLRKSYAYDLGSPAGNAADPLDDFLFVSQKGHCEFYSTAMVVLLRELGVPARNVTGFIGGSYNRFGRYYAVRQGDAHSWVEVFLDDKGWTTFDPTPPSESAPKSEVAGVLAFVRDIVEASSQRWDRYVVGYDLHQQVYLFDSIAKYRRNSAFGSFASSRGTRGILLSLCIALPLAVVLYRRWQNRRRAFPIQRDPTALHRVEATSLYESLEAAMSMQGIGRSLSTPPLKHAETLLLLGHPLSSDILELTETYLQARFGGALLSESQRKHFEQRVRLVRTARAPAAAPS